MGCRERKAKKELLRVVRGTDGVVSLDFGGKLNGRGAYICGAEECQKKLADKKLLNKAFGAAVDNEVYLGVKENALGKK
jgi:predicted RNA-binding protein YlxR (DUF448 family)